MFYEEILSEWEVIGSCTVKMLVAIGRKFFLKFDF